MTKNYEKVVWCIFSLERIAFYALVPLNWEFAYQRMQNLDVAALRTDFWTSIANCHMQPPLFNCFVGMIAKFIPESMAALVVQSVYFILAILAFVAFRRLVRSLVESASLIRCLDFAYLLCPTVLFAERWFTYVFPIACGLLWASWLLLRLCRTSHIRYFIGFLAVITTIVLTRSFYHVICWMLPSVLIGIIAAKGTRSAKCWLLAVFFLLFASVPCISNFVRYGMFTPSTWQGMNMFNTLRYVSDEKRVQAVDDGHMHPVCLLPIFANPRLYIDAKMGASGYGADAQSYCRVLDSTEKSSSALVATGEINHNHRVIPFASKEYQKGWKHLVCAYPGCYALGVLNAAYLFCGIDVYRYWDNMDEWASQSGDALTVKCVKIARAFAVPMCGMAMLVMAIFGIASRLHRRHFVPAVAFVGFTVVYTFFVAILCELGENGIMRVPVDPLLLLGVGLFVNMIVKSFRHHDAGPANNGMSPSRPFRSTATSSRSASLPATK